MGSDEGAETRSSHRAGFARHGVGKALALERGRQVGFATVREEAGKEGHDISMQIRVSHGAAFAREWGRSFDVAYVVIVRCERSAKCEAQQGKSDTNTGGDATTASFIDG